MKSVIKNLPKGAKVTYSTTGKKYLTLSKKGVIKAKSVKKAEVSFADAKVTWNKGSKLKYLTLTVNVVPSDFTVCLNKPVTLSSAKKNVSVERVKIDNESYFKIINNNSYAVRVEGQISYTDSSGVRTGSDDIYGDVEGKSFSYKYCNGNDNDSFTTSLKVEPMLAYYKPKTSIEFEKYTEYTEGTELDTTKIINATHGMKYYSQWSSADFIVQNIGKRKSDIRGIAVFYKNGQPIRTSSIKISNLGAGDKTRITLGLPAQEHSLEYDDGESVSKITAFSAIDYDEIKLYVNKRECVLL